MISISKANLKPGDIIVYQYGDAAIHTDIGLIIDKVHLTDNPRLDIGMHNYRTLFDSRNPGDCNETFTVSSDLIEVMRAPYESTEQPCQNAK